MLNQVAKTYTSSMPQKLGAKPSHICPIQTQSLTLLADLTKIDSNSESAETYIQVISSLNVNIDESAVEAVMSSKARI